MWDEGWIFVDEARRGWEAVLMHCEEAPSNRVALTCSRGIHLGAVCFQMQSALLDFSDDSWSPHLGSILHPLVCRSK